MGGGCMCGQDYCRSSCCCRLVTVVPLATAAIFGVRKAVDSTEFARFQAHIAERIGTHEKAIAGMQQEIRDGELDIAFAKDAIAVAVVPLVISFLLLLSLLLWSLSRGSSR